MLYCVEYAHVYAFFYCVVAFLTTLMLCVLPSRCGHYLPRLVDPLYVCIHIIVHHFSHDRFPVYCVSFLTTQISQFTEIQALSNHQPAPCVCHTVTRHSHCSPFLPHLCFPFTSLFFLSSVQFLLHSTKSQRFKHHPIISQQLSGGQCVGYGARLLTEGGVQSLPRLAFPGGVIVGCAGGMVDVGKIKGVHSAIESGQRIIILFVSHYANNLNYTHTQKLALLSYLHFLFVLVFSCVLSAWCVCGMVDVGKINGVHSVIESGQHQRDCQSPFPVMNPFCPVFQ